MIDREHALSLSQQVRALNISRGSIYYLPRAVSAADLAVMRRIDELHLELPFAGSRMLRDLLNAEGVVIGRRHVATLMKRMGLEALYRKPNTSKPAPGHKIYPYLLRNLPVNRPNQVWAMDITYIPMARGSVYLAAVVDWFSRRILAWRLSITMEAEFCIEALDDALARHSVQLVWSQSMGMIGLGDLVARGTPRIKDTAIFPLIDEQTLLVRVEQVAQKTPNVENAKFLKLFLKTWDEQKRPATSD